MLKGRLDSADGSHVILAVCESVLQAGYHTRYFLQGPEVMVDAVLGGR